MLAPLLLLSVSLSSAVVVSPEGVKAVDPQLAVKEREAAVAYGAGDEIYVSTSNDLSTFSPSVKIAGPGHLSLGMRRGPRIAFADGRLVVSAIYGTEGKGRDGELVAWSSSDNGKSWEGPTPVSDVPGAAREGLHGMASSRDGRLACAWLDLRGKGAEVWVSTSTDGGKSWSRNVCAYRSPDGHVCECCHPSVAFGPKGELHVMFRNWLGGARDMYVVTSSDKGRTFGQAQKAGNGTWPLNACPMDGGSVVANADGTVTTVWRRTDAVYSCKPGAAELTLGSGLQPWAANGPGGLYAVWQKGGQVFAHTPESAQLELGVDGVRPVVAASPRCAIAAWADGQGRVWAQALR